MKKGLVLLKIIIIKIKPHRNTYFYKDILFPWLSEFYGIPLMKNWVPYMFWNFKYYSSYIFRSL